MGNNSGGNLGTKSTSHALVPTQVQLPTGDAIKEVQVGGYHAFLVTETNRLFGWGSNNYHQYVAIAYYSVFLDWVI